MRTGLVVYKPRNVTIGNDVSANISSTLQTHSLINIGDFTPITANCLVINANHDLEKRCLDAFYTL